MKPWRLSGGETAERSIWEVSVLEEDSDLPANPLDSLGVFDIDTALML